MSNLPPGTTDAMIDRELEDYDSAIREWDDKCHKCSHLRTDHETGWDPEEPMVSFDGACQFCSCKQFV